LTPAQYGALSDARRELDRRCNYRSGWLAYVVRCVLGGGEDADPMDGFEDTTEIKKVRRRKKDVESWESLLGELEAKK